MNLQEIGLSVISDFITETEEKELMDVIGPFQNRQKGLKERNTVKRYGSILPYNNFMASNEVPDYLNKFCERLVEQSLLDQKPDSVTINEYLIGQSIIPHIDSQASGPVITVLSLNSSAVMVLRRGEEVHRVTLEPRSIVQMRNEIRNSWMHSIEPVQKERYSIVFRLGTLFKSDFIVPSR